MAKITTTFSLNDKVSSVLNKISRNAKNLKGSMEELKTTTDSNSESFKKMNTNAQTTNGNFNTLVRKLVGVSATLSILRNLITAVSSEIQKLNNLVKEYEDSISAEIRLTTIMKQRMNATDDAVQSVLNLATAEQSLGVFSDDLINAGLQELATYLEMTDSLKALIPAMTNIVAQQEGFTASETDFVNVARMMGKVLQGQSTAMSRLGYIFTEAEKKIIETGTEEERVAFLTNYLKDMYGELNYNLAKTDIGGITKASNAINDLKERMGELLAPMKREFLTFKQNILEMFEEPFTNSINKMHANSNKLIKTLITLGSIALTVGMGFAVAWAIANWPITLTILGIGMIIKLLWDLNSANNDVTNYFVQTTGVAIGFVVGSIKTVYNAIKFVYNAVASVAELVNIIIHPIKTLESTILSVVLTILQGFTLVANAIDMVFQTHLSDGLKSATTKVEEWRNSIWEGVGDAFTLPRLELSDVENPFEYGTKAFNASRKITNIIDNVFTNKTLGLPQIKTTGSGSILVADENTVALVDELRDLIARQALEKYIIQVSQVTPQMNIERIEVNENADVDAVVNSIADGYEEAVNSYLGVN